MKAFFTVLFVSVIGLSSALAQGRKGRQGGDLEWTGGLRINNASSPGGTSNSKFGFQGGVLYGIPMGNNAVAFRTGGLLVMRDTEVDYGGGLKLSLSRTFIDVPVQIVADFGGGRVFGGFDLGFKMMSSCTATGFSSCTARDEKSMVIQPVVGADFPVADLNLGFLYELETEYSASYKQSAFVFTIGRGF